MTSKLNSKFLLVKNNKLFVETKANHYELGLFGRRWAPLSYNTDQQEIRKVWEIKQFKQKTVDEGLYLFSENNITFLKGLKSD